MSYKMSVLVISELLRLFVNTFTANDKHSLSNRDNLRQPIQTKLSKKEKAPSEFCAAFLKSSSHFKDFENKMNFIAYKFQNYRLQETWLDRPFNNQHVKGSQKLLKAV